MSPRKIAERSHTFTAIGVDTAVVDMSTGPMSAFALQVKAPVGVTAWTVIVEGSLDGTNFDPTAIVSHTQATPGDGKISFGSGKPLKKVRLNCTAFTGSGSLVATLLGTPSV